MINKGDEADNNFKSKFLSSAEEMKESLLGLHSAWPNWHNQGVMIREIDVIRSHEGW